MTGTLRKVGVLLLAAVLGAAFAAGSSTNNSTNSAQTPPQGGLVTEALQKTQVTLLAGKPGSGAKAIATTSAADLVDGNVSQNVANARYAEVKLGGHTATFAVVSAGGAAAPRLNVTGVPGSARTGSATLSALATYLYNAVNGTAPAVLLERGSGPSAVTFAVYDPAKPASHMQATGATEAMVIVNGHVTTYQVRATGSGVQNLVIASGNHQGQQLSAVTG